ncbi:Hypothetical protein, putative [Bodo saltans]|uniref:Uncharacterized protein n=1 Tax=Bodo saltans TaxID=75058 RepID=A0A0S4KH74_BODSA|nr:Hypothetical protein, putative [Bodo saltans]|eukprot:CUI14304.1 Hypothetical protein, putative [Bodo saltans]
MLANTFLVLYFCPTRSRESCENIGMIPSLNLQKLRCAPAPVLANASITTPRGGGSAAVGSGHHHHDGGASTDRSGYHTFGGPEGGGHEVSAIRSGAVDAAPFLGCDVDNESDVSVLRAKLKEAKSLLVALDAWYAARLAEKEQLMVYRLGQLSSVLDSPRAGGGASSRSTAGTVSSSNRNIANGTATGSTTPRRQHDPPTPTSQRRPVSPRLYPGTGTPTDRRRGSSPAAGGGGRAPSEIPPSESGSSVTGSRRYSTNGTRSPSSVVHPRPFGSSASSTTARRPTTATTSGTPYIPATGHSPRAPLSGSFNLSRIGSTPVTPMGTPRAAPTSSRVAGSSPLEYSSIQAAHVGVGVSPRQASLTTPISARSAGGAPVSARRTQFQTVNWSSSIPHATTSNTSIDHNHHQAHLQHHSVAPLPIHGGVVRGASSSSYSSSSGVATARVPPAASQIDEDLERRAQTPRY